LSNRQRFHFTRKSHASPDRRNPGHSTRCEKAVVISKTTAILFTPMPKPIARRKTKKAVAKRFKVTGTGKVMRHRASKRHLLVSKSAKRKRRLGKDVVVHHTDEARIKENLPFR
jgi:large subunit ribosomal protein L35